MNATCDCPEWITYTLAHTCTPLKKRAWFSSMILSLTAQQRFPKLTQVLIYGAFNFELSPMFLFQRSGARFKLHVISVKEFSKHPCIVLSMLCQVYREHKLAPEDMPLLYNWSHKVCQEKMLIATFATEINWNISMDPSYLHFNYYYYLVFFFWMWPQRAQFLPYTRKKQNDCFPLEV